MTKKPTKELRCAIYTRKSTEHGLELEFNSLDAQREACEAYIKSQASEGWRLLPKRYDDPAYSGGNMDRPALQKLLNDIEAGQVDVVVVYKIDRLTRSLADFAKLVEVFDAKSVSFVAVTQQFNTTTSMGRLTLNVLLSFAQFERELSSERVRDKIAASRKKGKWTGGSVPLGYDTKDKKLVVIPAEAKTVRLIYTRYLALKSIMKLTDDLSQKGILTKKRAIEGKIVGGIPFTYGPLAYLLKNRTYIGETGHGGHWYPAEHEPIIERGIFEQVQRLLKSNSIRRTKQRQQSGALLAGLLYDDRGNRMSPSFSTKRGARYPFYISTALHGRKSQAGSVPRVPAAEIEAAVMIALREQSTNNGDATGLTARKLVEQTIERVIVKPKQLMISLKANGKNRPEPIEIAWSPTKRRNLVSIDERSRNVPEPSVNPELVQAVVRAHVWRKQLTDGVYDSIEALAHAVDLHPKVVRKAIQLAFLAPVVTRTILRGAHFPALSLGALSGGGAISWKQQADQFLGRPPS